MYKNLFYILLCIAGFNNFIVASKVNTGISNQISPQNVNNITNNKHIITSLEIQNNNYLVKSFNESFFNFLFYFLKKNKKLSIQLLIKSEVIITLIGLFLLSKLGIEFMQVKRLITAMGQIVTNKNKDKQLKINSIDNFQQFLDSYGNEQTNKQLEETAQMDYVKNVFPPLINDNIIKYINFYLKKKIDTDKINFFKNFITQKKNLIQVVIIAIIFIWAAIRVIYLDKKINNNLKKDNTLYHNIYFAYINQPFKFINDNFSIDSKNLDYITKKTTSIIFLFFNNIIPFLLYFILNCMVINIFYNIKFLLLILVPCLILGVIIYKKIMNTFNLYKELIPINEMIYKKTIEFNINFKQLKALEENQYFFDEISNLKKKKKTMYLKLLNNSQNNIFIKIMPFIFIFNYFVLLLILKLFKTVHPLVAKFVNFINVIVEEEESQSLKALYQGISVFIIVYLQFLMYTSNIKSIFNVFSKIIKIESYMKKITIQPMEDKPYVNFKANGNIIIRNGNNERLENINMTIDTNKGNIFGILGESGSGKTSLCNAITGNSPFSNKSISFLGNIDNNKVQIFIEDLNDRNLKSTILLLKQEGLNLEGSLKENLLLGSMFSDEEMVNVLNLVGLGKLVLEKGIEIYLNEINEPINEFNVKQLMENPDPQIKIQLKIKGLQYQCGPFGNRLSGGQRQKLSIARLLLRKPKILVLDEPTTGFDPISSIEFMKNIKLLSDTMKAQGNPITIILITHDLDLVAKFANYIFFMRKNYNNKGEIAEEGDPKQLLINKKSNFALQYFALKDKN